jgi:hypothetical protein
LDWYNEKFEKQNGGCGICSDGPGTRRLHVDHDHKYAYVKIESRKCDAQKLVEWETTATYNGNQYINTGRTKSEAIKKMKLELKRDSVRGLLCHRCNRGMILFRDRIDLLEKAIIYNKKFSRQISDWQESSAEIDELIKPLVKEMNKRLAETLSKLIGLE